jgi:HSF-type DNA-binding
MNISNDIAAAALLRSGGTIAPPTTPTPSMSALDASSSATSGASATDAALLRLLLLQQQQQKQQREDQEKAFLIRQLMALMYGPSLQQQAQSPSSLPSNEALDWALLLQLQKSQREASAAPILAPPPSPAATLSALSLLSNASSALAVAPSSVPSSMDFDAFVLAKLLLAQQTQTGGASIPSSSSRMSLSAASLPLMAQEIPERVVTARNSSSLEAPAAVTASSSSPATGSSLAPTATTATTLNLPMVPSDRGSASSRKGRTGTFPQKLHQMLSDLERLEGGKEIASFLPHGRSFAIHKPRDFVKFVMTKHFRMSRFSSFQRQLNLYDFQRINEGSDKGAYCHDLFVQGRPILSTMMKRNKIKGINGKNGGMGKDSKKKVSTPAINNDYDASHSTEDEDESSETA